MCCDARFAFLEWACCDPTCTFWFLLELGRHDWRVKKNSTHAFEYIVEQRAVSGARGVCVERRKNGGEGRWDLITALFYHTPTQTHTQREIHNKHARTTVTEGRVECVPPHELNLACY